MRKLHIAIGVSDIARSVKDYTQRLGAKPVTVIPNEYALWRTTHVNFSIRKVKKGAGSLRHLGWEDSSAKRFSKTSDCNGVVWELFTAALQEQEIESIWPCTNTSTKRTRPVHGRGVSTSRRVGTLSNR